MFFPVCSAPFYSSWQILPSSSSDCFSFYWCSSLFNYKFAGQTYIEARKPDGELQALQRLEQHLADFVALLSVEIVLEYGPLVLPLLLNPAISQF